MILPTKFSNHPTPFYLYDTALLRATLGNIKDCTCGIPIRVHYAIKANGNPEILRIIAKAGFGADCVSGGEVNAAIQAGFPASSIVYAGVGKTDSEIRESLLAGIGCFNVESVEELEVIASIASEMGIVAPVALRINPNIDAHTHHYITTGLEENKFGIDLTRFDEAVDKSLASKSLHLRGLHFHIGSQITTMEPFKLLGERINNLIGKLESRGIRIDTINVGGGLGIDYDNPEDNPVPDFSEYFETLMEAIDLHDGQEIHCELGRSIVAQCGSLITRVVYVKQGIGRKFVIVDGGMSDLIRPALYGAHHAIVNLSAAPAAPVETYDVVGPICESSDVFAKDEPLPRTHRGDLIAFLSAGAYGESMASHYNMRTLYPAVFF